MFQRAWCSLLAVPAVMWGICKVHDSDALSFYNFKFLFKQVFLYICFQKVPNLSVLHVNNCVNSFTCSIDSIYKTFVYKILWIFTVKCLQLFNNKELYVYFVQAFFWWIFKTKKSTLGTSNNLLYLKGKSPGQPAAGCVQSKSWPGIYSWSPWSQV